MLNKNERFALIFLAVAIVTALMVLSQDKIEGKVVLKNTKEFLHAEYVFEEYDITKYAPEGHHEPTIKKILRKMPIMNKADEINQYIQKKARGSKITGKMVLGAATKYGVDHHMMLALMQLDSHFGTRGKGARNKNPGNVGTYGTQEWVYNTWEDGVHAVAWWLSTKKKRTSAKR